MNYILTAWDCLNDCFMVWGTEEDTYTLEEITYLYRSVKDYTSNGQPKYKDFCLSVECNLDGEII